MALPLVHAARHNDVKPLLGRELMILTHDDDDDDDVCMYVPLWDDGIQLSTWRVANALAHDDGMFTLWTTPDGNVCM